MNLIYWHSGKNLWNYGRHGMVAVLWLPGTHFQPRGGFSHIQLKMGLADKRMCKIGLSAFVYRMQLKKIHLFQIY